MNESDFLKKNGQLFSEKQYKSTIRIMISSLVFSGLTIFLGTILAMVTNVPKTVIAGLTIGSFGFLLMIFTGVYAFRKAYKIQLYRRYKRSPEDFEKEIK